jgi:hypothetical protein
MNSLTNYTKRNLDYLSRIQFEYRNLPEKGFQSKFGMLISFLCFSRFKNYHNNWNEPINNLDLLNKLKFSYSESNNWTFNNIDISHINSNLTFNKLVSIFKSMLEIQKDKFLDLEHDYFSKYYRSENIRIGVTIDAESIDTFFNEILFRTEASLRKLIQLEEKCDDIGILIERCNYSSNAVKGVHYSFKINSAIISENGNEIVHVEAIRDYVREYDDTYKFHISFQNLVDIINLNQRGGEFLDLLKNQSLSWTES